MDNGRHNAIFSNPEVDDNLNEENWQKSLEISAPVDLPSPEQLSKAAEATKTADVTNNHEQNPLGPAEPTSELGQITPVASTPSQPTAPVTFDASSIKTTGDYLDKASLDVIDSAIHKLDQTGNLSDFYDEARNMTEVNLNNSFNRKLDHGSIITGEKT